MKLFEKILVGSAGAAGAGTVAWRTLFPWIGHDLRMLSSLKNVLKERNEALKSFLIDKFEDHVKNHPRKPFIIFEDSVYTYEFMDQMACKVANIFRDRGLKLGDTVAIVISNEPAFIWTFLGFQKLGVSVAFINYNLKMGPLVHSIKAADTKHLIVGQGHNILQNVLDVKEELTGIHIFAQGLGANPPPQGIHSFDPVMQAALSSGIDPRIRSEMTLADVCCYIYTSGTTGPPKACNIDHRKVGLSTTGLQCCKFGEDDRLYIVLPLYHSAATLIGACGVIAKGATMVLKKKFSASQFWADCCRYDVTVIQYIGELFRYLLAQPPSKYDSSHKVRAAFGNGLRKDIWVEVNDRFKIPLIAEFFGATEGTTMLLNVSNKPGAIGRLSPLLTAIDPDLKVLVKFDYSSAQPIRDRNGRCIRVKRGEPGLFLSQVPSDMIKDGEFNVYKSSKEVNEKKLVRNAFKDGDIFMNYGDVFVQDDEYFLYFKDRIGDTFRWKGENVSTTELANVITSLSFVEDANVYGVLVPGHDGRAGMVALTLASGCKLGDQERKELFGHIREALPDYAQPLFVRHLEEAVITGTFKQRKVELVQEAYDLDKIQDPIYFRDLSKKTYSALKKSDLPKFLSSKL